MFGFGPENAENACTDINITDLLQLSVLWLLVLEAVLKCVAWSGVVGGGLDRLDLVIVKLKCVGNVVDGSHNLVLMVALCRLIASNTWTSPMAIINGASHEIIFWEACPP